MEPQELEGSVVFAGMRVSSELGREQQLSHHIQNSKWTRMPKAGSSKPRRLGNRVDVPEILT